MKKIVLILIAFPLFSFGQTVRIIADSTILKSVGNGYNELVIRNATQNVTNGVLTNIGNGKTAFIYGSGAVSQSALDDSMLSVRNIRKVDTIYKNLDSIIYTINGERYSLLDSSGSSLFFPNGIKFIDSDYEIQSSDEGKFIIGLSDTAIHITMPTGVIFTGNNILGIRLIAPNSTFGINSESLLIYPLIQQGSGISIGEYDSETIIFSTLPDDGSGNSRLIPISTAIINDNGTFKTINRYLIDNIDSLKTGLADSTTLLRALISSSSADSTVFATLNALKDTSNVLRGLIPDISNLATKIALKDSTALVRGLIPDVSIYATTTNLKDTSNVLRGLINAKASQSALNDSITTLRNIRKVDSSYLSLNAGLDSLIFINLINGTRYRTATLRTSGGGGGSSSLSGLTASTATNTINNLNFAQEWQWNTLATETGLKLSSNSTLANSNTNTLFSVNQTGANANALQTTTGAVFSNTKTGSISTNIGIAVTATGATNNLPIKTNGVDEMARFDGTTNPHITFYKGGVSKSRIGQFSSANDILFIQTTTTGSLYLGTNSATQLVVENNRVGVNVNPTCPLDVTGTAVSGRMAKLTGGSMEIVTTNDAAFYHTRASVFGTFGVNASGNFILGCDASGTGTQIAIHSTRNNVGIGTVTPVASAKLELNSTTQGFLPPRMTATQASAISSPAQGLMIFVTDTNGTFTSIGWWGYGTSWKLILAQ